MKSGVPAISPSPVSIVPGAAVDVLDQPEVEHLDEVVVGTEAAHEDVRRLDVAVEEPARVRLASEWQTCRSR